MPPNRARPSYPRSPQGAGLHTDNDDDDTLPDVTILALINGPMVPLRVR
jgi:hypothetical protein